MQQTLEQLAIIERRDRWIRRLSQMFFAALFALLLTGAVVGGLAFILNEREQTQRDSRAAATRRIDLLQGVVNAQAGQIADNARQLGRLSAAQDALIAQLRQNGLAPVVTVTPRATPTKTSEPKPRSNPKPAPTRSSPSPRPHPAPSPSPSPTPRRLCVVGLCIPPASISAGAP